MKKTIHPNYFDNAKVICVCGNTFETGSTLQEIRVEVCSKCHPFFTGEARYVDTLGRVERFQKKQKEAKTYQEKKAERVKEEKAKPERPDSLRDLFELAKKQASS